MGVSKARRLWWLWLLLGVIAVAVVLALVVAIPILAHRDQGLAEQLPSGDATTATAVGDDGRTRTISVAGAEGAPIDPSALAVGERLVVTGSGFDASRGVYVAICVIPDSPDVKPGPCIGGAPQQTQDPEANAGAQQYAASNWINDDWAWKLFGSRSYDSVVDGAFTAYLLVGEPVGEGFDCRVERCGIVTRNDHTAASDRVQDVYLPVGFAPAS
ncbi:MAG TPA: hypothetical protein VNQ52_11665 [Microbacteriaceae bacterium]|nr:hypothetical protein [Microbacteriaceae bacterium]